MGISTNPPISKVAPVRSKWVLARIGHRFELVFQISLLLLLASIVYYLLAPGATSVKEYFIRVFLIGVSSTFVLAFWLILSSWKSLNKWLVFGLCELAVLAVSGNMVRGFANDLHIVEPGRVHRGRIIHDALGLSYAVPPGGRINLLPVVMGNPKESNHQLKDRTILAFGEMAIISRIVVSRSTRDRATTSIVIGVQYSPLADFNSLLLDVGRQEATWTANPNRKIVQKTHPVKTANIEAAEFEFVEEPQHLMSRQLYVRSGDYVLNFMLNTEDDADRSLFDKFLNSINLEPTSIFGRLTTLR